MMEFFTPILIAVVFLVVFFGFFFLVGYVANQFCNQYYHYFWQLVGFGMWVTILVLMGCAVLWGFGKLLVIAIQSQLSL